MTTVNVSMADKISQKIANFETNVLERIAKMEITIQNNHVNTMEKFEFTNKRIDNHMLEEERKNTKMADDIQGIRKEVKESFGAIMAKLDSNTKWINSADGFVGGFKWILQWVGFGTILIIAGIIITSASV